MGKRLQRLMRVLTMTTAMCVSLPAFLTTVGWAQAPRQPHSGEIEAGLRRLGVVGSVLYVAAHPDDENSRLLAWLVGERGLSATYLSLTRGDGGQNLIGLEQDDLLGLLRTHELLAARQVDGAEQLFTRAKDLGYTKRADEALQIWGHDAVLGDVVQAMRRVRPDVVITRFNTLPPNHGHHTASALLAAEAFGLAGDAARYPEQVGQFAPWKPTRLLHNVSTWNLGPGADMSKYLRLDVGGYDPLRGRSWTEVAAQSRSQHKSQGFGVTAERGPSYEYFQWLAGDKPGADPLGGLDLTWRRFAGGAKVQKAVEAAIKGFVPGAPERSIPALWTVHAAIAALPDDGYWKARKLRDVEELLVACAGLVLDARAATPTVLAGGTVQLTLTAVNRSAAVAKLVEVTLPGAVTAVNAELAKNQPVSRLHAATLPAEAAVTTPYWLRAPADGGLDHVPSIAERGLPDGNPALLATFVVELGGHRLSVMRAVRHVWNDAVKGEQSRLLEVAPARVVPPMPTVRMIVGNQKLPAVPQDAWTERAIHYDHVPPLTLRQPLRVKDVPVSLQLGGKRIGYIPGPGDRVAESLAAVGYAVTLLPLEKLATEPLDGLDAVVVGIRALNQGPELGAYKDKLRAYMEGGGRVLVQYQTQSKLAPLKSDIFPYPLELGRERVTDENAAMVALDPREPLLHTPNPLTAADFAGWVQERGLYFAQKWDPRYRAVFAMADVDETPLQGGLLVAKVGKGTFAYTGLAFFRQLPAGVPGAYRLLANLLAL